ncbi:MAG: hypothetical protein UHW99_00970 [Methanobrevibacter sp.]|nr:hypothetical protein [Methanobrevibacter sp.]
MENRNIIIILVVIIVVLAAAIGFTMFNPMHAKEPTKIKITSDKEQYEGGELSIQLTDLNKTPLSKEVVNITITNGKGKVVFDNVEKTDSKGKAKIDLDLKKGKYNVTVSYGGNENYTGNTTTQKLTIKEEEKVTQTEDVSAANSLDKYKTQSGTIMEVMPSGDIVEMSADGSTIVSVNGDPNGGGH